MKARLIALAATLLLLTACGTPTPTAVWGGLTFPTSATDSTHALAPGQPAEPILPVHD